MPKVSIIVPIYNSEKFLDKCISSLLNQTMKDIEIILVSDASPDNSKEIMEYYAREDKRIVTIYNKENGYPNPRNAGICSAKSEYLGFVDADDWVEHDMYEKLYEASNNGTVDVVASDVIWNYKSGKETIEINLDPDTFVSAENVKSQYAQYGGRLFANIWKKDMITDDILFKDHFLYADTIVPLWYFKARSFAKLSKPMYHYFINDESITHMMNSPRFFDRAVGALDMLERAKKNGLYEKYQEEIDYVFYRLYYKNTLILTRTSFTKLPLKELKDLNRIFHNLVNIDNNKYYLMHEKETDNNLSKLMSKNEFLGIASIYIHIKKSQLAGKLRIRSRLNSLFNWNKR